MHLILKFLTIWSQVWNILLLGVLVPVGAIMIHHAVQFGDFIPYHLLLPVSDTMLKVFCGI